jgi:hypothetical protein
MVFADDGDRARVIGTVPAAAFAVVIRGIGVEARSRVVRVAFAPFFGDRFCFFRFSFFGERELPGFRFFPMLLADFRSVRFMGAPLGCQVPSTDPGSVMEDRPPSRHLTAGMLLGSELGGGWLSGAFAAAGSRATAAVTGEQENPDPGNQGDDLHGLPDQWGHSGSGRRLFSIRVAIQGPPHYLRLVEVSSLCRKSSDARRRQKLSCRWRRCSHLPNISDRQRMKGDVRTVQSGGAGAKLTTWPTPSTPASE